MNWYWDISHWIDVEHIFYIICTFPYQFPAFPRLLFILQGKIISSEPPDLLFFSLLVSFACPPLFFFNTDIRVRTLTRHAYLTRCLTRRPVASPSHYPAFNVGRRSNLMRIRRRGRPSSPLVLAANEATAVVALFSSSRVSLQPRETCGLLASISVVTHETMIIYQEKLPSPSARARINGRAETDGNFRGSSLEKCENLCAMVSRVVFTSLELHKCVIDALSKQGWMVIVNK